MLYAACCMLHVVCCMLYAACCMGALHCAADDEVAHRSAQGARKLRVGCAQRDVRPRGLRDRWALPRSVLTQHAIYNLACNIPRTIYNIRHIVCNEDGPFHVPVFVRILGRCMLHVAFYTACCTLHAAFYTACCTLHVAFYTACCTLHVAYHTACCTLHVARCMLHVARCLVHCAPHGVWHTGVDEAHVSIILLADDVTPLPLPALPNPRTHAHTRTSTHAHTHRPPARTHSPHMAHAHTCAHCTIQCAHVECVRVIAQRHQRYRTVHLLVTHSLAATATLCPLTTLGGCSARTAGSRRTCAKWKRRCSAPAWPSAIAFSLHSGNGKA
jgi:hypothetical protein